MILTAMPTNRQSWMVFLAAVLFLQVTVAYDCPSPCSCYFGFQRVILSCTNRNFVDFPEFQAPPNPETTKILLSLDGNQISTLNNNSLNNLTRLVTVDLRDNPIVSVEPYWAGQASEHIEVLKLTNTGMSEDMIAIIVSQLNNLEILDISKNRLSSLSFLSGLHLPHLQSLLIDGNQFPIQSVDSLSLFPLLNTLVLSNNSIQYIESDAFENISETVILLDLSENNLTAASLNALSEFNNLKTLYLDDNQLDMTELTVNLSGMVSTLTYMDISRNPLKVFPESLIREMKDITTFHIDGCQLSKIVIPVANSSMPSLMTFSLENNRLNATPSGIEQLVELRDLNLAGNLLYTLPSELKDSELLTKLNEIDFSRNLFQYPNKKLFQRHTHIQKVTFSHGPNLWAVPDYIFAFSAYLSYIDLSNNVIEYIGFEAFTGIAPQAFIDLSNNRLFTIQQDVLPSEPIGLRLDLQSNPFKCDCNVNWLMNISGEILPPGCAYPVSTESEGSLNLFSVQYWNCETTTTGAPNTTTTISNISSSNETTGHFNGTSYLSSTQTVNNVTLMTGAENSHTTTGVIDRMTAGNVTNETTTESTATQPTNVLFESASTHSPITHLSTIIIQSTTSQQETTTIYDSHMTTEKSLTPQTSELTGEAAVSLTTQPTIAHSTTTGTIEYPTTYDMSPSTVTNARQVLSTTETFAIPLEKTTTRITPTNTTGMNSTTNNNMNPTTTIVHLPTTQKSTDIQGESTTRDTNITHLSTHDLDSNTNPGLTTIIESTINVSTTNLPIDESSIKTNTTQLATAANTPATTTEGIDEQNVTSSGDHTNIQRMTSTTEQLPSGASITAQTVSGSTRDTTPNLTQHTSTRQYVSSEGSMSTSTPQRVTNTSSTQEAVNNITFTALPTEQKTTPTLPTTAHKTLNQTEQVSASVTQNTTVQTVPQKSTKNLPTDFTQSYNSTATVDNGRFTVTPSAVGDKHNRGCLNTSGYPLMILTLLCTCILSSNHFG